MERAYCIECGEAFWRQDHETWKRLCIECWRRKRFYNRKAYGDSCGSGEIYRLRARVRDLEAEVRDYEYLFRKNEESKALEDLGRTLKNRARDILFLIHPDKHDGNPKAHELALWINTEVRQ